MRIRGIAVGLVVLGLVAGCTSSPPTVAPAPSATATSTPQAEVASVGEPAIPLGCADLLQESAVAHLGADVDEPIELAIDEDTIVVDMAEVAALQAGQLHCIWAARYGATDFHAQIEVRISPTDATALDPAAEQSYGDPFVPLEGDPATLISCSEGYGGFIDDPAYYNACQVVQLRDGYRVELDTSALKSGPGRDSTVALELLAALDTAIDGAAPAREVPSVAGTPTPTTLCTGPEVGPVLDHLGASGAPTVEKSGTAPVVTTCSWHDVDANGNETGPYVEVLPGGAWALRRLGSGLSNIFLPTHPSAEGNLIIGLGDGVSAWRAIGDDLVAITSWDYDAVDGWESFIEDTW